MNKKIIIFDYDGVIVDSLEIYAKLFVEACKKYGYQQINSKEKFLKLFERNIYDSMMIMGINEDKIKKILNHLEIISMRHQHRIVFFDGMKEVLSSLSNKHRIIIVTSNITSVVEDFVKKQNVIYDEVIGADKELSKVKRIESIKLKYKSADYFYIGDTMGDIIEGKLAGVKTVAVSWGWHNTDKLKSVSPDYIVKSPSELIELFNKHIDNV